MAMAAIRLGMRTIVARAPPAPDDCSAGGAAGRSAGGAGRCSGTPGCTLRGRADSRTGCRGDDPAVLKDGGQRHRIAVVRGEPGDQDGAWLQLVGERVLL